MIPQNLPEPLLQKIVRRIHGESELNGCMIGYSHMGHERVLHKGVIPTRNMLEKLVMVQHVTVPPRTRKPPPKTATPDNISRFGPEMIGVGCSLMCFAFSVAAVGGGAVLTPETGPVGAMVAVAGWTGLASSGVQTYNGVARLWQMAVDPYGHELAEWDEEPHYANAIVLVDFLGCAGSIVAIGASAPLFFKILQTRGSLRNVTPAMLKAMSKPEREQKLRKAYEDIIGSPGGREELAKAMNAAKISIGGLGKARHSGKVAGVISEVARNRLRQGITEELISAIGPGFSLMPAALAGSASGYVNRVATGGPLDPGFAWLWGEVNIHVLHRGS